MQDQIMPSGKWVFDEGVTNAFDDMLSRSIPQIDIMRGLVREIVNEFITPQSTVIDLGTSQGAMLQGLSAHCIGIEISKPMADKARERLPSVDIREIDLRYDYPDERAKVALSILTLQFTPIEYRLSILKRVYENLLDGGVFILVEKVLGSSAVIDKVLVDRYYDLKRKNGYTDEQIERKRLSLEGVLVPVTAKWNEDMLHLTGFKQVDCFWRWLNFSGWIAIK